MGKPVQIVTKIYLIHKRPLNSHSQNPVFDHHQNLQSIFMPQRGFSFCRSSTPADSRASPPTPVSVLIATPPAVNPTSTSPSLASGITILGPPTQRPVLESAFPSPTIRRPW